MRRSVLCSSFFVLSLLCSCFGKQEKVSDLTINSFGNNFSVQLIANAPENSINPNFPKINISTDTSINAWIQVVYTDAKDATLKVFIDAVSELFPIYTYNSSFEDAPLWTFTQPTNFNWVAHTYAINIDKIKEEVTILGGVKWGFKMTEDSLKPQALEPEALVFNDWEKDKLIFKDAFSGYTILY